MAKTNIIEPSGVHFVKSVMVVLTLKSNEVILNMDDLRLVWGCLDATFGAIYSLKYC